MRLCCAADALPFLCVPFVLPWCCKPASQHVPLSTFTLTRLLYPSAGEGDDSADYRSGEDDDADNAATIEEEEALAAAEGRDVKVVTPRGGGWVRWIAACQLCCRTDLLALTLKLSGIRAAFCG